MCSGKMLLFLLISICISQINSQSGPDPWNFKSKQPELGDEVNLPLDLRMPLKRKIQTENKLGIGEWFFKRTLAIILRGGQTKKLEDGSMDISLQMKFDPQQWETLDECLNSDSPLSEEKLRRTVGYVEGSIYKPSIVETIVLTWSEYVQGNLTEYKTHITWTLCFLTAAGALFWLWSHMSHKHVIIIAFIIFYAYEVIISYKEAEQKEVEKFISAVNMCSWFFWKSNCEVPPPDPIVFLKHMNPLKIGIRMITSALAEPIVAISGTIEVILHGVTDGLWYPFDKLTYGILAATINISLIYFLLMIIFNWLLNIPFHLGFGLFGVSLGQRNRTLISNSTPQPQPRIEDQDRISQATVNRMLNVFELLALNNAQNTRSKMNPANAVASTPRANVRSLRRSASTGRLPNHLLSESSSLAIDNTVRRRNIHDGGGDA